MLYCTGEAAQSSVWGVGVVFWLQGRRWVAVEIILLPALCCWLAPFFPCCLAFIKTPCLGNGFAVLCRSILQCSLQQGRAAVSHSGSAWEDAWVRSVWVWGWTFTWHLSAYTQCRWKRKYIYDYYVLMCVLLCSYVHIHTDTQEYKCLPLPQHVVIQLLFTYLGMCITYTFAKPTQAGHSSLLQGHSPSCRNTQVYLFALQGANLRWYHFLDNLKRKY